MDFHIQYFDSLDSTNKEALRQAEAGAKEGLVIVAHQQTSGKGRLGRTWFTIEHALAFTLLLRPNIQPIDVPKLSLLTAVALHEALSIFTPNIRLKWPNDLLIDGKKVSGILTEMRCANHKVKAVILGIGINIKPPKQGWPQAIQQPAIDLSTACQTPCSNNEVLQAVLRCLHIWYERFLSEGFEPVRKAWWHAHIASNKMVCVHDGDHYIEGLAQGLANDGALRLLVNGEERRIIVGDVSLIGNQA